MTKILVTFFLLACLTAGATTFTEFYVQPTGRNTNSGHTIDDAPTFSAVSGNWTNSTATFFKSALNPVAGGVTNGAWASVYLDAFPTNALYIGVVTNANDTADTIQLDIGKFAGSNPANSVGGMSISVGGAWAGPNTNTAANGGGFPFAFIATTATNAAAQMPRVNIKSGTTYNVTAAMTCPNIGPYTFEGYTTIPGDGGRPVIDGGRSGSAYALLTISGNYVALSSIIFTNNGSSGNAHLVTVNAANGTIVARCVFTGSRNVGAIASSAAATFIECEAYGNNLANAASSGGFHSNSGVTRYIRCISHDNSGSANQGFIQAGNGNPTIWDSCIADSNGANGFYITGAGGAVLLNCDSYNNVGGGIMLSLSGVQMLYAENCNFLKNTIAGITNASSIRIGAIYNCGFGSGTQANGATTVNMGGIEEIGSTTYAADATPWVDPDNGDFRITLAAAKSVGRGSFVQTAESYAGTVAYPDVGAAQSASTNAAAGAAGGSYTFAQ